jgi:Tfp pilus assembly protein PilN
VSRGRESRPGSERGGALLANLAAAPFLNQRPVQRFALVAWVLGTLLLAVNVLLWVQYRHESTALRGRLASTRAAIEEKSVRVVEMDQELRGLRLPAQNAQVAFLNNRIAERTFPWSLLFERIAATLPDGVRLMSLTPVFDRRTKVAEDRPAMAPEDEVISLKINGVAKNDDSLYGLIDAFFADPTFARPRLYNESSSKSKGGEVSFTVDVDYRPRFGEGASPDPDAATARAAPEDEAAGSAPVDVDPDPTAASEDGVLRGLPEDTLFEEDGVVDQHDVEQHDEVNE